MKRSALALLLSLLPAVASAQIARDSHADIGIGVSNVTLKGDLESEKGGGGAFTINALQYPVEGGFASGFYVYDVTGSGKVKKAGFGYVESDDEVETTASSFGIELGWRFPSETELTFGLGTLSMNVEQDDGWRTFGGSSYHLRAAQGFLKYGFVGLTLQTSSKIEEKFAGEKYDLTMQSSAITFGFRMRAQDWQD